MQEEDKVWFSTTEASRRLGIAARTIRSWAEQGKVSYSRPGSQYLFHRDTIEELGKPIPQTTPRRRYTRNPDLVRDDLQQLSKRLSEALPDPKATLARPEEEKPTEGNLKPSGEKKEVGAGCQVSDSIEGEVDREIQEARERLCKRFESRIAAAVAGDVRRGYQQLLKQRLASFDASTGTARRLMVEQKRNEKLRKERPELFENPPL